MILGVLGSSCETIMDVYIDSGKTKVQLYNEYKCSNGTVSRPGVTKRIGCVNSNSVFENKMEYWDYQNDLKSGEAQLKVDNNDGK